MSNTHTPDPTQINWPERQAKAAVPFEVVNGRPIKPGPTTGLPHGQGQLWHWGEQQCADPIVFVHVNGRRWVLLIERADGFGWAFPGGKLDGNESALEAMIRELIEEAGLSIPDAIWEMLPARVVPDPRGSDEAWMTTTPFVTDLGELSGFPVVEGADDARRAAWVLADSYDLLVADLWANYQGTVFVAHAELMVEAFGR